MIKVFTTIVTKDGKEKQVYVYVNNQTAKILSQCDESMRNQYIAEEYKIYKADKKEKQHNVSLDELIENKYKFPDSEFDVQEIVEERIEKIALRKAIKKLNPRQQKLIYLIYFKGMTQEKVAEIFGIKPSTISHLMSAIFKKLKSEI